MVSLVPVGNLIQAVQLQAITGSEAKPQLMGRPPGA